MGSLMGGWDSPGSDPERARFDRNRSLMKAEIESFRRLHKISDEEEEAAQQLSPTTLSQSQEDESSSDTVKLKKPAAARWNQVAKSREFLCTDSQLGSIKGDKTGDWWTRSNWAFLNEPPHDDIDESSYKYASQFHVAEPGWPPARKHI